MLYIFVDESGNFDFSIKGTKYYIISALSVPRPFPYLHTLIELKHDLWQEGHEIESFHAAIDSWPVRNKVFDILCSYSNFLRVDSIIIEKRKTHPVLQNDTSRFFRKMFNILIGYVLAGQRANFQKIVIVTDRIPVQKRRKFFSKAIKLRLANWANQHNNSYEIYHYEAKSEVSLQVVDYLNWAIFRKWEWLDKSKYDLIKPCIMSEFEVFKDGSNFYY